MQTDKKDKNKEINILIADDSPTMRMMLQDILGGDGYTVLSAEDGIQAAEMAFKHSPDLIISDIEMPKMNGYQVCRLLKNDPATSNIPVIILTSKGSTGAIFWGYQTGADLYVLKDFKPQELLVSIEGLLDKYKDRIVPEELAHQEVDKLQIMEKLNLFLDGQLFEMTLINEINQVTVDLTSISDALSSLLIILDRAIENYVVGFAIFTDEKDILLSLKQSRPVSRKALEILQYQALEDLAITVNKDISDYNIEVELQEDAEGSENHPEPEEGEFEPDSIYSIPIRSREEVFGLLNVYHPRMDTVAPNQKNILEKLAPYISTAIGAISMHNRIKGLSVIDGLTQLYNRRFIMELFKTEFNKTSRYNLNLSLLMIDIDDFKKINDTYGHLSGDLVLKKLSAIIKNSLRSVDLPGRYGGEEFILILPETDKLSAVNVAERIREQVQKYRFKTMNGEPLTVTISLGLGEYKDLENKSNELELIKIADSRLYKAKRTGKNKVVHK